MEFLEIFNTIKESNFLNEIKKNINLFQELCGIPLTGIPLEGLIARSFRSSDINVEYNPMSHDQNKDMTIILKNEEIHLSIKGCKENKTRITYSSFRTTKFKTLEEKINYVEETDNNFDVLFILSRFHQGKEVLPEYYRIYLVASSYVNPKKLPWNKVEMRTHKNEFDINMGFTKSMSDQLWVNFAISNLNKHDNELRLLGAI